jgi:hypothetical protein
MPARNVYHDLVVHALMADRWKITADPLGLSYGGKDLFAERFGQLIIKSQQLRLIVFDEKQERIVLWIH